MKIVRSIILFFAIALGFVLQSEVYQTQLWSFATAHYVAMEYDVKDKDLGVFLTELKKVADEHNVSLFSTHMNMESNYQMNLNIYGNEKEVKDSLYRTMSIEEKTYRSLFSGITNIKYYNLMELTNQENHSDQLISFVGKEEEIQKVYENISTKYNVGNPKYWEATERDMIMVVWFMIVFLLVVLNCIEVLRRKKEVVVRISLGESVGRIIAKSIIVDMVLYVAVYVIARFFVFNYISGEYERNTALIIYVVGGMLSFLPYVSYVFYDIKKAFSNVNDSKSVLYALYGLRLITTVLTIFTLTTNISNIQWNMFSDDDLIEQYEDYTYIQLRDMGQGDYEGELLFWDAAYEKEYDLLNPVICMNVLEDKEDYLLLNKNAKNMMQGFTKMMPQIQESADVVIFVPIHVTSPEKQQVALECLETYILNDVAELNVQYIEYDTRQQFSYLSSRETYGIGNSINPIIIFQNSEDVKFAGSVIEDYGANQIIFNITHQEVKDLSKKYANELEGYEMIETNVKKYHDYQKNFLVKMINFLSSLCVIVLVLDVAVIVSINTLEYRNHAMDLSLKKILGYKLVERYKRMFAISMGVDFLVMFVLSIIGFLTRLYSPKICVGVGVLVAGIEMLIIFYNIMKIEKENVHKVLKGGCL